MINFTKAHKDSINNIPTVRLGKIVPDDAVNLAYFYNKKLLPFENIFISEAARKTIDHLDITNSKNYFNAVSKNDSLFPDSINYIDDEGYTSTLNKIKVSWATKVKNNYKEKILKYETIITNKLEIEQEKTYDDEKFKGTLKLVNYSLTPFVKEEKDIKGIVKKVFTKKDIKDNVSKDSGIFYPTTNIISDGYNGNIYVDKTEWFPNYRNILFTDFISVFKTYSNLDTIPNTVDYINSGITYKFPLRFKNSIDINLDLKEFAYGPLEADNVLPIRDYNVDGLILRGKLTKIKTLKQGNTEIKTVYYDNANDVPQMISIEIDDDGQLEDCPWVATKELTKVQDVLDYYDNRADVPLTTNKVIDNIPMNGTLNSALTLLKNQEIKEINDLYDEQYNVPYNITRTLDNVQNMKGTLIETRIIKETKSLDEFYANTDSVPKVVRKTINGIDMRGNLISTQTNYIDNVKIETKYGSKDSVPQTVTKVIDGITLTGTLINVESINVSTATYDIGLSQYWTPSKNGYMYGGHSGLHYWSDKFPVLMNDKYGHWIEDYGTLKSLGYEYDPEIAAYYFNGDGSNANGMIWLQDYNLNKGWPPTEYVQSGTWPAYNYLSKKSGYRHISGNEAGVYYNPAGFSYGPGWPTNYYVKPTLAFYRKGSTTTIYYGIYKFVRYSGTYEFKKHYGFYEFKKYYGNYTFKKYYGVYNTTTYYGAYLFNKYECEYKGKLPIYDNIESFKGITYYKGELSKEEVTGKETKIKNYKLNAIYQGIVDNKEINYDGTAYYEGMAIRPNTPGNILPNFNNILLMYPDESGKLKDFTGNYDIRSDLFYVTNVFKDDEPLFYRYKLSLPVYSIDIPDDYGYIKTNLIKLVNNSGEVLDNKYKYTVKFQNKNEVNLYDVYIYTNFEISNNNSIYAVYNAYDTSSLSIKTGHKEIVKVAPFLLKDTDYTIITIDTQKKINSVIVNNPLIINDDRNKIKFTYKIVTTDAAYLSNSYEAYAINYDYALTHEKSYFKDKSFCVSIKDDMEMTAKDIIINDCMEDLKDEHGNIDAVKLEELNSKIFKVIVDNTDLDDKIYVYTNPEGNSGIYVETTEDTGFLNTKTNTFTDIKALPYKYKVDEDIIYPVYAVKCNDIKEIKVLYPKETESLENWYPRIQNGRYTKEIEEYGIIKTIFYSLNEYDTISFSPIYKKPYIDITDETAKIIDEETIKIKNTPLFVDIETDGTVNNLSIKRISSIDGSTEDIKALYWSFNEGIIKLNKKININDIIKVNYTYEETSYSYRGFYNSFGEFIDIDLNPLKYHTYLDNRHTPYERKPVYELFNEVIYFFVKPSLIVQNKPAGDTFEESVILQNINTVYHKIGDDKPNDLYDMLIGKVYIRHNTSSNNIVLIDTRSRGGGIKDNIKENVRREIQLESDYYFDIGYFDGEPYNENSVIIIRIDKRVLIENGGNFTENDINNAVNKWIAFGTLPIIEFI